MAIDVAVARRLFTREEYHRMGEVGILKATDRVELIRGEIVEMSPIGRRHYAFVNNLSQLLIMRIGGRAIVAMQEPEREAYTEDAFLLIEVAESSLAYDRSTKLKLYAAAGIPEYWVVDCVAESIEIQLTPQADGYRETVRIADPTATVAPQAFPDVVLTLAEVFA